MRANWKRTSRGFAHGFGGSARTISRRAGSSRRETWVQALSAPAALRSPRAAGGLGGPAEHPLGGDHDDAGEVTPRRPGAQPRAGCHRAAHWRHGTRNSSPRRRHGSEPCRIDRHPRNSSKRSRSSCATVRAPRATAGSDSSSLVAANSLAILRREGEMEDDFVHAEWAGLDVAMGVEGIPRTEGRDAGAAERTQRRIRASHPRGRVRWRAPAGVAYHLYETVLNKVRIANPAEAR